MSKKMAGEEVNKVGGRGERRQWPVDTEKKTTGGQSPQQNNFRNCGVTDIRISERIVLPSVRPVTSAS